MKRKIPRRESELWSYLRATDGKSCPFYSHCFTRLSGDWCPDDSRERTDLLIECRQFNLSDYDFIKPEGRDGKCTIHQMVKVAADTLLRKGEVNCPPVPTELILMADEQHPVELHVLPLKAHHGAIWREGDRWVIQIRDKDRPATQRYTLFHEVFHILAHLETAPAFSKRGIKGVFNELLANIFAACVLMPEGWLREKWAEVHDLDRMARIFGVPKEVLCVRLKRLGVI